MAFEVTPSRLARLLAGCGYPRKEIERALRQEFPDEPAGDLADEALAWKQKFDRELDQAADQEK